MMGNLATLLADLGDKWPGCADDLTDEVAIGLRLSESLYNLRTAAAAEELRIQANEAMARAFEQVDFIIAATNPGPGLPGRRDHEQQREQLPRLGHGERRRQRAPSGACCCGIRRRQRLRPTLPVGAARARRPSASPTS